MKILLIGDLSSAGYYLQMGLESLGIYTTHIGYQNGWRENPIQINLTSRYKGIIGKVHNYVKPFTLNNLKGYDLVIFLDYFTFPRTFGINSNMVRKIQENNKNSFLWVMGCDSTFREWGKIYNSELCEPCLKFDQKSKKCNCENNSQEEQRFLSGISKIIPCSYEYFEAHKSHSKISSIIQLPMIVKNVEDLPRNKKIKFFHGLNRYGFKGTDRVEAVFSKLKNQYSNVAEFKIDGKMSFENYNALLLNQDVIVDQLYNKSLGINSLLTLAQGKILIAGDPKFVCEKLNIPLPPMITTGHDLESLTNSITGCINNYNQYKNYAEEGRKYIAQYHSPEIVASKFLNLL